jgi:hypothetical protein
MRISPTLLERKLKLLPLALKRASARLAFTPNTTIIITTRSYQRIRKMNCMNGEPEQDKAKAKAKARAANQMRGRSPVTIRKRPLHRLSPNNAEKKKAIKQAKTNGDKAKKLKLCLSSRSMLEKRWYLMVLLKHLLPPVLLEKDSEVASFCIARSGN